MIFSFFFIFKISLSGMCLSRDTKILGLMWAVGFNRAFIINTQNMKTLLHGLAMSGLVLRGPSSSPRTKGFLLFSIKKYIFENTF